MVHEPQTAKSSNLRGLKYILFGTNRLSVRTFSKFFKNFFFQKYVLEVFGVPDHEYDINFKNFQSRPPRVKIFKNFLKIWYNYNR